MTKPNQMQSRLPDILKPQTKHVIKIVFVDYLIQNEMWADDVIIDDILAWDLIPHMVEYDEQWKQIESKEDLQARPFYKDLMDHLKYQLRNNG